MAGKLKLSQAVEGLLFYKTATGKSPCTIADYRTGFQKLLLYFDTDPLIASITHDQLVAFFAWLQDDYISEPDGVAPRGQIHLSPKSIKNIHTALSALWTWAVNEGYVEKNIVHTIAPPRVVAPVIETFTQDEIKALLKACDKGRTWKTRDTTSERPTADRDRAIVMTLLDSGVRASELCTMKISDVNLAAGSIKVIGKGSKERIVLVGRRTSQTLWRYLTPRLETARNGDTVFVVSWPIDPHPMDQFVLDTLLKRIGERAGVSKVYPHKFRHTFAINYLRNGGDLFTLQELLGHAHLEMVKRYARIAQIDCANAHRQASPVDNWRL
jgi:integrase/recombinase XerD